MSAYTPDLIEVGVSKESVRQTAIAPSAGDFIKVQGRPTITEENLKKEDTGRMGDLAYSDQVRLMVKRYTIAFRQNVDRKQFMKYIYGILGAVSTSANVPQTGVHTHVFTRNNNNLLPSYTTSIKDPNETAQYAESIVSKIEIDFPIEDYIGANIEMQAAKKSAAVITPSYQTANSDFIPVMTVVKNASAVAGLAAATASKLSSLRLTMERLTTAGYHYIGNYEADKIISGVLKVSGEGSMLLEDLTMKLHAQADNEYKAWSFKMTDTTTTIGVSTNPSIDIQLGRAAAMGFEPDQKDEYVEQRFQLLANRDTTNGDVKVTAINDVASY
jgi:hypothetical protein